MTLVTGRRLYDWPIGSNINACYWKRGLIVNAIKFNSDRRRTPRPNSPERRQRA